LEAIVISKSAKALLKIFSSASIHYSTLASLLFMPSLGPLKICFI